MFKFQQFIKRVFDVVVSALMIVFLTIIPVFIIIPIGIKLTSKGPAVFVQDRVGKDGKIFKIYKFRTMNIPPKDSYVKDGVLYRADGEILKAEDRIYKFGNFLRKTSLDEIMQLFNILNGTMSFVGPRPTLPHQVEKYTDEQRRRLDVRPGVTGWAQVNGRNDLTWTEKIKLDIQYIDNFSLWFDIKILFMTVGTVLGGKGIAFNKFDELSARKK